MEEPADASISPVPPADPQPSRAASGGRSARVIQQLAEGQREQGKRYSSFLSHFKREAGTEARLVQMQLKGILGSDDNKEVFLDSDNLHDLRLLLDHVKDTEVLVLLQTTSVLTRPWVILELYTAVTNNVPIVALNVHNSYPYDYTKAMEFLLHFDEEIDIANPGAAELLIENGVDPVDVAYRLSDALPNIISTDFNPNASSNMIRASLEDLADAMRSATPLTPTLSKETWLANRESKPTTRQSRIVTTTRRRFSSFSTPVQGLAPQALPPAADGMDPGLDPGASEHSSGAAASCNFYFVLADKLRAIDDGSSAGHSFREMKKSGFLAEITIIQR